MTPLPDALKALRDKWRATVDDYEAGAAARRYSMTPDEAGQLSLCADELDTLLASLPSTHEGAKEPTP